MPVAQSLAKFKASVAQCEKLIENSHQLNPAGAPFLPLADREQITVAAFLNMFVAWESFLEDCLTHLLVGAPTMNGAAPVKYAAPHSSQNAQDMIVGTQRYFDYANHDYVRRIAKIYFQNGHPFEPHLGGINSDLQDLKTIRNSCAHLSSTTRQALDSLALRIFGQPKTGISVYQMLLSADPKAPAGETLFQTYRTKLIVTAELISNG